ncbi:MAG: glycosyltransferase, partial [Planctomycetaceae bacterium]
PSPAQSSPGHPGSREQFPPSLHSAKAGLPIVLLEQNRVAGRATSWLSRKADVVCLSFPETVVRCDRVELTGNPVRASVAAVRDSQPGRALLVLGGSQGAVGLNSLVMSILDDASHLPEGWRVIHQAGSKDESRVREHYASVGIPAEVHSFISNMPQAYADSGLVISRAGGTTIAELCCIGRASVLVPIPKSVRDHQRLNAECFAESNAAVVLPQDTAIESARAELIDLMNSEDRRDELARSMKLLGNPDAAAAVADIIA